jgi:hypothetical protein
MQIPDLRGGPGVAGVIRFAPAEGTGYLPVSTYLLQVRFLKIK